MMTTARAFLFAGWLVIVAGVAAEAVVPALPRVDGADLALWQKNYGPFGLDPATLLNGTPSLLTPVPEPASTAMPLLGGVGMPAVVRVRGSRRVPQ